LAKRRKNIAGSRKKPQGKRPLVTLLIVAVLILSAFFLLEKVKRRSVPPPVQEKPVVTERHKMPERKERPTRESVEQQPYTTVIPTLPPKHPRKLAICPGSVAIIIDDMGSSVREVNELMAINLPLTFSIIPGLAHVKGVAAAAHARGYQLMIHIPMEPKGYPQQRMEHYGLLLSLSDEEIRKRMDGFLREVPYAKGANNHMGSRFTEERDKMETVLGFLKEKGLFFIDSKTSPRSVGNPLAREMAIENAGRNVFLDNVQDVEAIREQLEQLAAIARRKGAAIGICHPHKATIQALAAAMPELQRSGITFVSAAVLVR
jgi:polysaccharide deacetylase 2 family uncharacterized protein YibQ